MDFFAKITNNSRLPPPSETIHYVRLHKGQKVSLRSGKVGVVEGFTDNYLYLNKDSLPYHRGEVNDSR